MSLVRRNQNRTEGNSLNFFRRLGRIGTSIILLIVLVCTSANAQKLDSVAYTYNNDTLSVYVRVFDYNSFDIGNITSQESGKVLKIDICVLQGFTPALTTKDTLIDIVPQQHAFDLEVNLFMEGSTTSCADSMPIDQKKIRNIVSIEDRYIPLGSGFQVFPNPASNNIRLHVSDGIKVEKIKLFNVAGKLAKTFKPDNRNLDVSDLPAGLYSLKVKTMDRVLTQRVLIQ